MKEKGNASFKLQNLEKEYIKPIFEKQGYNYELEKNGG